MLDLNQRPKDYENKGAGGSVVLTRRFLNGFAFAPARVPSSPRVSRTSIVIAERPNAFSSTSSTSFRGRPNRKTNCACLVLLVRFLCPQDSSQPSGKRRKRFGSRCSSRRVPFSDIEDRIAQLTLGEVQTSTSQNPMVIGDTMLQTTRCCSPGEGQRTFQRSSTSSGPLLREQQGINWLLAAFSS